MVETKIFKILTNKIRVEIIKRLSTKDYCVKELADLIGKRSSKICDELAVLRSKGIVESYSVGIKTYYHLKEIRYIKLIKFAERQ
jgi:predicted transcriptional regulator